MYIHRISPAFMAGRLPRFGETGTHAAPAPLKPQTSASSASTPAAVDPLNITDSAALQTVINQFFKNPQEPWHNRLVIGRDPNNCNVVIAKAEKKDFSRISRQHLEITYKDGVFTLKDQGSLHGFWLESTPDNNFNSVFKINPGSSITLQPGWRVSIGVAGINSLTKAEQDCSFVSFTVPTF